MSRDREAEAQMRAIFGHRPRPKVQPAPPKPQRAPEASPEPRGIAEGPIGIADPQAAKAWEADLGRNEQERWAALQQLLDAAGPEMRWRAASYIMRAELDNARKALQIARNLANESYKAELIRRNGVSFREALDRLDRSLAPVYRDLLPLAAAIGDLDTAYQMVVGWHGALVKASQAWTDSWPGSAKGRGLPGYDTPAGVRAVQEEVDRSRRGKPRATTPGRALEAPSAPRWADSGGDDQESLV